MRFIDKKEKLDYLLFLIQKDDSLDVELLSQKIYVSKRTLIRYIQDLRELGFHIGYCSYRKKYYLLDDSKIKL